MSFGILKLGDLRFGLSEISWVRYVMQAFKDANQLGELGAESFETL